MVQQRTRAPHFQRSKIISTSESKDKVAEEMGKAQLEAQSAATATSAIAEVALRFNF